MEPAAGGHAEPPPPAEGEEVQPEGALLPLGVRLVGALQPLQEEGQPAGALQLLGEAATDQAAELPALATIPRVLSPHVIGSGSQVGPGVVFEGPVVIGNQTIIQGDVRLGGGCEIQDDVRIRGTVRLGAAIL